MGYRKYANDYRLEVLTRPGKKPKTVPVYVGPRFQFLADGEKLHQLKAQLPVFAFGATACFAGSLFLNCSATRHYLVLIPYLCCFLAYFYLCASVCGFLYRKPPLTREQNDTIPTRIPICTIIPLILNCFHVIVSIIYIVIDPPETRLIWDIIYLALSAVQIVLLTLLFRCRRDLETYEITVA